MKYLFALIAALTFAGCANKCDCDNCCDNCVCVDCDGTNCECCVFGTKDKVAPVDDSNKAYVTVFGDSNDAAYQRLCQYGRQTAGVHYAEISTDNPMYARYSGQIGDTPRIVIQSADGKVLYKGNPATYTEWRNRFNDSCPDGNCRPRPEPAPVPAPSPAPAPAVEPIPDSPDSPTAPVWLMIAAGVGGAAAGSVRWWKDKYFAV